MRKNKSTLEKISMWLGMLAAIAGIVGLIITFFPSKKVEQQPITQKASGNANNSVGNDNQQINGNDNNQAGHDVIKNKSCGNE